MSYDIGSIVLFRGREWVVTPPTTEIVNNDIVYLKPLTGSEKEGYLVYLPLERKKAHKYNMIEKIDFPIPTEENIGGDFESIKLLLNATRLLLRDGAAPFQCLGRISFRPRPYQFVPLLMALKLNPVRMLIADDVGVGKTIEAGLIIRELLDRGEINRLAVICPPYLCEQWQKELSEKFNIDAKIIRTSTLSSLEKELLPNESIFEHFPFFVSSIDFVKTEKRKANFIQFCPEMLIIDEAHNCSQPSNESSIQQQRHRLIDELLKRKRDINLLLVTATPHSGIEESFLSLIGFIKSDFQKFNLSTINEIERKELAKHFIQRRRKDVEKWMGENTSFPERYSKEVSYTLSQEYQVLFKDIYNFSRVSIIDKVSNKLQRGKIKYWAALTLLRCVMSSPEAAKVALSTRMKKVSDEEIEQIENDETDYSPYILDYSDTENTVDVIPTSVMKKQEMLLNSEKNESKKLVDFLKRTENIISNGKDTKLFKLIDELKQLLKDNFKPIIFCRFVATAKYLNEQLQKELDNKNLMIKTITGIMSEEERDAHIKDLSTNENRILIATDCLSEGINLQNLFNSVIHYDLPWNPNRLEQREGRIDRFGQQAKEVRTILLYGENNPIDGSVLNVLLRKAKNIHKTLGINVPLPIDSESIMETVLKTLFDEIDEKKQMELFDKVDLMPITTIKDIHNEWDKSVEKEKRSRTLFAQYSIKPEEIAKELEETDNVLGNPKIVEDFVKSGLKRIGVNFTEKTNYILIDKNTLTKEIKSKIGDLAIDKIAFNLPTEEVYISRNHPLTVALAEYILNEAFRKDGDKMIASRISVTISKEVETITILYLLRIRYLIKTKTDGNPRLVEECMLIGFKGLNSEDILEESKVKTLLENIKPSKNIDEKSKERWVKTVISNLNNIKEILNNKLDQRASQLVESYTKIRESAKISGKINIEAVKPADIMGISIIIPESL